MFGDIANTFKDGLCLADAELGDRVRHALDAPDPIDRRGPERDGMA